MKNSKAQAFNRKASSQKSRPDEVIVALGLKQGQSVADIGAGGGYFSLRFAETVGAKGKIYAIDINQDFLEFIKNSTAEKGLGNLEAIFAEDGKVALPERSIDRMFFRNVTHHIKNRVEYFRQLMRFMAPGGRIAIIEYKKKNSFTFHGIFRHYIAKETLMQKMENAGYAPEKELISCLNSTLLFTGVGPLL
ncbi:MAG: methyltransferase domain-containing protein [Candidatus Aenigmatarchaeota archaeon]